MRELVLGWWSCCYPDTAGKSIKAHSVVASRNVKAVLCHCNNGCNLELGRCAFLTQRIVDGFPGHWDGHLTWVQHAKSSRSTPVFSKPRLFYCRSALSKSEWKKTHSTPMLQQHACLHAKSNIDEILLRESARRFERYPALVSCCVHEMML